MLKKWLDNVINLKPLTFLFVDMHSSSRLQVGDIVVIIFMYVRMVYTLFDPPYFANKIRSGHVLRENNVGSCALDKEEMLFDLICLGCGF